MRTPNEKKMFELLLDEIEDTLQDIEQRCLRIESSDQTKELQVIFRAAHNVKGASQLYGLTEFGNFVHSFEDVLTTLQKMDRPISTESVDLLLYAQNFLREWVLHLRGDDKHTPDTVNVKALLRQHVEELKSGKFNTEAPVDKPAAAVPKAQTQDVPHQSPTPAKSETPPTAGAQAPAAPADSEKSKKVKRSTTLRIPSQKIDEIIQLIGELSINQGIIWHHYQGLQKSSDANDTTKTAVNLNQKILKDLYDLVLTLRMQPADGLFQRIEKTARDIARDQKKKVNITMIGADVPLDKTVIELITDPMMHLVRNAIDHGIEDEEERIKTGKNPDAKLTIKTQQDSGNVIITISDDGRGMDPEIILNKAIKKGLVDASQKMREDEIIQLIYLPGFSTRETVTEISGRGVGMDIVQKAIQSLGGRIETTSKKGQGSTFQITLPASLEITEGLLVRVEGTIYIIPRQEVEEIIDLNDYSIEKIGISEQGIRMREQVVPVEDITDYIGMSSKAERDRPDIQPRSANAHDTALLVRLADRTRLALRVGAVLAQQQIVVRPLADQLSKVPGFTGVTILGNGEPAMIIGTSYIGECFVKWVNNHQARTRIGRAV